MLELCKLLRDELSIGAVSAADYAHACSKAHIFKSTYAYNGLKATSSVDIFSRLLCVTHKLSLSSQESWLSLLFALGVGDFCSPVQ